MIAGLGLEHDEDSLIALYVAGLSGIGYGLRQLLDRLRQSGIPVASIVASGGAARNPVVCQILADATATSVLLPSEDEPVLRGAAMLASVAAATSPDLPTAMATMSGPASVLRPAGSDIAAIHLRRYAAFECLQLAGRRIRDGEEANA